MGKWAKLGKTGLAFGLPVSLTLVALTSFIFWTLGQTREAVLQDQARGTAELWATYFRSQIPDLHSAFAEGHVNNNQLRAIETGVLSGDVFRFKMFSPSGHVFFVSDEGRVNTGGHEYQISETAQQVYQSRQADIALYDRGEANGRTVFYAEAYLPVISASGELIGVMEIYTDVTAAHEALTSHFAWLMLMLPLLCGLVFLIPTTGFQMMRLQKNTREEHLRATRFDSLTGVLSRAALEEEAIAAMHDAVQKQLRIGLLFIDVDKFKHINDSYGHAAGDAYLRFIARILKSHVRPEDTLGRFGGDEFIILLPNVTGPDLLERASRILVSAREEMAFNGKRWTGSLSIGAHVAPLEESYEVALHNADLALYAAKSAGRDRAILFGQHGEPVLRTQDNDRANVA